MIVYAIIERASGQAATEKYGHNLGAMGLSALDRHLDGASAAPLSSFLHEDKATLERALQFGQPADRIAIRRQLEALEDRPEWHDPARGLKTVRTLLQRLPQDEPHEGIISDLKMYEKILEAALGTGDLFRINLVTSD